MVGFDSIIPPGRVGSITEKVKLTNYRSGSYSKAATVTLHAKKTPVVTITMRWIIKAYVAVLPTHLEIVGNNDGVFQADVTLSSEKADLKLLSVSFKPASPSDQMASWQEDLTIPLSLTLLQKTKGKENMHDFKYKLTVNYIETQTKSGEFIFKTNHPEAPEVKINGAIIPGAAKR